MPSSRKVNIESAIASFPISFGPHPIQELSVKWILIGSLPPGAKHLRSGPFALHLLSRKSGLKGIMRFQNKNR